MFLGTHLWEILFPTRCFSCKQFSKTLLCSDCQKKIFTYYGESRELDLPNYLALFKYTPELKAIIQQLKTLRKKQWLPLLQDAIIKHVPSYPQLDYIIPVPLNPKRQQIRGFNQAEELIKSYALLSKVPLRTDILYRQRHTKKIGLFS